jgi:hypothetical protein
MLVDNTTCLQLVFKECLSTLETGSSGFTSIAWWWNSRDGKGRFSDKVIKIPSRRGPDALRFILNDFEANGNGLSLDYYDTKGEKYFMNS